MLVKINNIRKIDSRTAPPNNSIKLPPPPLTNHDYFTGLYVFKTLQQLGHKRL